jgi:hypothetical protein
MLNSQADCHVGGPVADPSIEVYFDYPKKSVTKRPISSVTGRGGRGSGQVDGYCGHVQIDIFDGGWIRKGRSRIFIADADSLIKQAAVLARKVRLQYPGALYHLINRGDRRESIFRDDKAEKSFWQL